MIRSQLGRAGLALVDKATRLAGVTPAQFWSGPEHQATPASPPNTARADRASARRKRAAHDTVISLVPGIPAEADLPSSTSLGPYGPGGVISPPSSH